MKAEKTVDIQKIMKEIREEAENRKDLDIPEFSDVPLRVVMNMDPEYHYVNANWNIPYYLELQTTGLKKQIMRVIRKLICFTVKPQRDAQNMLNASMVRLFNYLLTVTKEQQLQIDSLQKRIRDLEKSSQKAGKSK